MIVGAGTAGSIVAGRLATTEEQWEVALLENGGPYPTGSMFPGSYFNYAKPGTAYNWDFPLQPQDYACKAQPRGICRWPRGDFSSFTVKNNSPYSTLSKNQSYMRSRVAIPIGKS